MNNSITFHASKMRSYVRLTSAIAPRFPSFWPLLQRQRRCLSTAQTPQPQKNNGPLKGIKVLDLTRVLAGPFCTQLLADYGADVLKIEQPGQGDETRTWRSQAEAAKWKSADLSMYFSAVNRNKRSITLNLKKDEARSIVYELVKGADVFVENFISGKLDKMGLSYDKLSAVNPRIIYASLSGYGSSGPYSDRGGYDAIAGAEGGLMHVTGFPDGPPMRPGLGMTDMSSGLLMHGAILAALHSRSLTGQGQHISASLFETQLSLLINIGTTWLNLGIEGQRWGAAHPQIVPYNTYQTKDGMWFALGANSDRQFAVLCRKFASEELLDDPRYSSNSSRVENRAEVDQIVAGWVAGFTTEEMEELLKDSGLAHGPVNTIGRALGHPQAKARDMVQSVPCELFEGGQLKVIGPAVKFSKTRAEVRASAPSLGEHTSEVLRSIGYVDKEIERLSADGVT